jgi:hypothetical protein
VIETECLWNRNISRKKKVIKHGSYLAFTKHGSITDRTVLEELPLNSTSGLRRSLERGRKGWREALGREEVERRNGSWLEYIFPPHLPIYIHPPGLCVRVSFPSHPFRVENTVHCQPRNHRALSLGLLLRAYSTSH